MLIPRPKRYGWWRKYVGFWDHPKWMVIGVKAHVPALVAAADVLCERAGKS